MSVCNSRLANLAGLTKPYLYSYMGLPKACYSGITMSFIQSIFIGIYYYLSLYFTETLHLDVSTSGVVLAFYGVGAVVGGLFGGIMADRYSPGNASALSLLMQSFAYLALAKLHAIHFLLFEMFILGVSTYAFITANYLVVLDACAGFDDQRLKAINILSMITNLGLSLAAMIISLCSNVGFDKIFLFSFAAMLVAAIFGLISSRQSILSSEESSQRGASHSGADQVVHQTNKRLGLLILSCVFFVGLIVSQIGVTYSIFIKDSYPNLGIKAVTFLFGLNAFLVFILSAALGEYIKRYNKILMVGYGGLLIGVGMLMLTISSFFILAVLACVVYTTGEIIFFSMA